MKNKILQKMEQYFDKDKKRINHARAVLNFAEQIMAVEAGDQEIVTAAAILHDIGIHAAEKKHGSTAGKYQEIEGPPIAKNILEGINFPQDKIAEVLDIIGHHHTPGKVTSKNFQILYEADWLVNLKDEVGFENKERLARVIDKVFVTPTGKQLAQELYLTS